MRLLSGLVVFIALVRAAAAAEPPAAFTAVYALSQGAMSFGTMERRFELDTNGAYRYSSRIETSGVAALLRSDSIVESSSGQLRDGHFLPAAYDYRNSHGNKHFALSFDYAKSVVARSDQSDGWQASMPDRLQDKLVYQLQMMLDLGRAQDPLRYAVADKNKLKDYQFQRRGEEDVKTARGRFRAVRLEKAEDGGDDRRTTVWCAKELNWLPVKVEYRDKDGSVTTALLRSLYTRS